MWFILWTNTIASNGKITVASVTSMVNTNPPNIQFSVTGGNTLNLAWPANSGWTLLTNSVALTATNQWFPYPNSANLTNVSIPMSPSKTNVFFQDAVSLSVICCSLRQLGCWRVWNR